MGSGAAQNNQQGAYMPNNPMATGSDPAWQPPQDGRQFNSQGQAVGGTPPTMSQGNIAAPVSNPIPNNPQPGTPMPPRPWWGQGGPQSWMPQNGGPPNWQQMMQRWAANRPASSPWGTGGQGGPPAQPPSRSSPMGVNQLFPMGPDPTTPRQPNPMFAVLGARQAPASTAIPPQALALPGAIQNLRGPAPAQALPPTINDAGAVVPGAPPNPGDMATGGAVRGYGSGGPVNSWEAKKAEMIRQASIPDNRAIDQSLRQQNEYIAPPGPRQGMTVFASGGGIGNMRYLGSAPQGPPTLPRVAQAVASHGRGGDSTLVHMRPHEVAGLARLKGAPLSRNPRTGLPEAFDLGSLLGGVLGGIGGIALAPETGGLSLAAMGALGSGLGSTAGSLIGGNSWQSALGGGLVSGLLGYGLGSAFGSLGSDAVGTAAKSAEEAAASSATKAAPAALSDLTTASAPYSFADDTANTFAGANLPTGSASGQMLANNVPAGVSIDRVGSNTLGSGLAGLQQTAANAGTNLSQQPMQTLWNTFGKNALKTTLPIAGAVALGGGFGGANNPAAVYPNVPGGVPNNWTYPNFKTANARTYIPPPPGWSPDRNPEWNYYTPMYAGGGKVQKFKDAVPLPRGDRESYSGIREPDYLQSRMSVMMRRFDGGGSTSPSRYGSGEAYDAYARNKYLDDLFSGDQADAAASQIDGQLGPQPMPYTHDLTTPMNPYIQRDPNAVFRFAAGGSPMINPMMANAAMSAPPMPVRNPIQGPGGGIADTIPAIIDGQRPAALSSGEHVIPAAAVSALGNGSTEEGSRQLEGMTSRILQHKYGTANRRPRPMNPRRFLPR